MNVAPNKAREIFIAALQLAPDRWQAYLDEACGQDAALRERVKNLLNAHREAGSFLEPAAGGLVLTADDPATDRPGAVIGPYKLLQQIGEGGMGTVFMAEQTKPVQRKVALKIIKPGMDSAQVLARFEAERQALALMDHPHIAKILDAGTTGTGRPYFVMELVKGVPITKHCDERRLTPKERLRLFVPVCQAVQHAHQKGIIHRDLKPSNVLVALYDGHPLPKVIDFGVAKATGPKLTERTLFTEIGAVVGTLEYMSPEQAELNQLDIDTRSDIYALGVLLYELLTGTTPLERKRLKVGALLEALRIIREEEPPRPSTRLSTTEHLPSIAANRGLEPKKLSGQVRGELDWIVMKCLEKGRDRRYDTASGLALDLERYLHDEPVQAGPPSAWYRFGKFARRNRGRLTVAAGVFLALVVMASSVVWAVRSRAEREEEAEREEIARRTRVEVQVRDAWSTARTLIADNKVAAARLKLAEAQALLGNDQSALGDLAAAVEAGEAELERFQRFLELIDRAHQEETASVLEAALGENGSSDRAARRTTATSSRRRAEAAVPFLLGALTPYEVLERDDWAARLEGSLLGEGQVQRLRRTVYEELLWLAHDVVGRQKDHRSGLKLSPQAAAQQALVYLGKAESAHRPTQAFYVLRAGCRAALGEEAASRANRQLADKTSPTIALDHYFRGQAAYDAERLAEGVRAFEAALRLEPTHYWSMMRLGECLIGLGQGPEDFAGAARVFTGCILKRPDHALAYQSRGEAYKYGKRYEEAVADYSRAIELDPKFADAWSFRGVAYSEWGRPDKAVADCSHAIELNPERAPAWGCRGIVYMNLGQPDKAIADYSQAIKLDPKFSLAWYNRGVLHNQQGRRDEAVADLSRAIELDPKFANAWCNRGGIYANMGQLDKAIADLSRTIKLDPKPALDWYNRGVVYFKQGQSDKALADLSRATELNPKFAPAWLGLGIIHKQRGRHDEAVADLSRAIELDPTHALPWGLRGGVYTDLGQLDNAVIDYSQALKLDPKFTIAWYNRGNVHSKLGQPDKAVADYSRALELEPKNGSAQHGRGLLYVKQCEWEKAAVDYAQVVELTGEPADPAVVLAGLRLLLGDAESYERLCQKLEPVADRSKEPSTAYIVSRISALSGKGPIDPAKAVRWAERAVENGGNSWTLSILGRAHYRAGRYDKAILHCKASLSRDANWPGRMLNWLVLAMACHRLGQNGEARQWLEKADQWRGKLPRGKDGRGVSPPGLHEADWVEFHVLYREAEALLKTPAEKE